MRRFDDAAFQRVDNQYALKQKFDELAATMSRRHGLVKMKIAFSISFLGIGSLGRLHIGPESKVDFVPFIFFAPWIPLLFDVLIFSENYSVRRIGYFLESRLPEDSVESVWQRYVERNRDRVFRVGALGFSIVPAMLALFVLYIVSPDELSWKIIAFVETPVALTGLLLAVERFAYVRLREAAHTRHIAFDKSKDETKISRP